MSGSISASSHISKKVNILKYDHFFKMDDLCFNTITSFLARGENMSTKATLPLKKEGIVGLKATPYPQSTNQMGNTLLPERPLSQRGGGTSLRDAAH